MFSLFRILVFVMVRMHEFQMIPALHYKCKNMTYLDLFFYSLTSRDRHSYGRIQGFGGQQGVVRYQLIISVNKHAPCVDIDAFVGCRGVALVH